MNTKTILGISLGAVFVLSMIMVPVFAVGHVNMQKVEVKDTGKQSVEINVVGPITPTGGPGAFGFGAIGSKAILGVTTHGGVGPDSEAQAGGTGAVFHTHALQLTTITPCASGVAVASASFKEVGDLEVTGTTVEVKNISKGKIGTLTGEVRSFLLSVDAGGDICVTFIKTLFSE